MRHRYSGRKLNKSGSHKRAMFRNMTASLVEHELIKTTLPKANGATSFRRAIYYSGLKKIALLIVVWRSTVCAIRRQLASFSLIWVHVSLSVPGGYVRILKCGNRSGDNAPMAYVELVDRAAR